VKYVLLTLTFSQKDLPCVCSSLQRRETFCHPPKHGEVALSFQAPARNPVRCGCFTTLRSVQHDKRCHCPSASEESTVLATPKQGEVEILNQHGGAKYTGAIAQGWLQNFGL
jgi:hypothetical protein